MSPDEDGVHTMLLTSCVTLSSWAQRINSLKGGKQTYAYATQPIHVVFWVVILHQPPHDLLYTVGY